MAHFNEFIFNWRKEIDYDQVEKIFKSILSKNKNYQSKEFIDFLAEAVSSVLEKNKVINKASDSFISTLIKDRAMETGKGKYVFVYNEDSVAATPENPRGLEDLILYKLTVMLKNTIKNRIDLNYLNIRHINIHFKDVVFVQSINLKVDDNIPSDILDKYAKGNIEEETDYKKLWEVVKTHFRSKNSHFNIKYSISTSVTSINKLRQTGGLIDQTKINLMCSVAQSDLEEKIRNFRVDNLNFINTMTVLSIAPSIINDIEEYYFKLSKNIVADGIIMFFITFPWPGNFKKLTADRSFRMALIEEIFMLVDGSESLNGFLRDNKNTFFAKKESFKGFKNSVLKSFEQLDLLDHVSKGVSEIFDSSFDLKKTFMDNDFDNVMINRDKNTGELSINEREILKAFGSHSTNYKESILLRINGELNNLRISKSSTNG